ncbi:MAG TPA: RsmB/NOP family class I SAM-dependent RNA methyltransferase, partial [Myxococcota bacterium]
MSERDVVIAALARILAGERADAVVPAVLASLGADAGNPVRARVAGAIYRASIFRLRLAFTAGLDGAALSADDAPALVDALDAQQMRAWPSDPFARLVVERSCPAPLARALVDALGHHGADAFLAASNEPGPKVLRANTLRTSRDVLAQRLLADHGIATSAGEHAAHALVVVEGPERARANLFGSRAWRDGWFEVQDQASQCVALATGAKPGDVVVDLCAGRGGKTVALAAMMQDRGALHVHDVDERALTDLAVREKRAGLTCLVRGLPREGSADVVLVDAPCSSTGVLRRSPDLRF